MCGESNGRQFAELERKVYELWWLVWELADKLGLEGLEAEFLAEAA